MPGRLGIKGASFMASTVSFECPVCCGGGEPPVCCDCASLPATGTLTDADGHSYLITKQDCEFTAPFTIYSHGGTVPLCSVVMASGFQVTCESGRWGLRFIDASDGSLKTIGLDWDGDCDAILLTGTYLGCGITVVI